jgi:hypothetical protein
VPAVGDYDNAEISEMFGRGNRNTRRKRAPMPFCPQQIPHAARTRTRAAAVGSQRLTALSTGRLLLLLVYSITVLSFRLYLISHNDRTPRICIYNRIPSIFS